MPLFYRRKGQRESRFSISSRPVMTLMIETRSFPG